MDTPFSPVLLLFGFGGALVVVLLGRWMERATGPVGRIPVETCPACHEEAWASLAMTGHGGGPALSATPVLCPQHEQLRLRAAIQAQEANRQHRAIWEREMAKEKRAQQSEQPSVTRPQPQPVAVNRGLGKPAFIPGWDLWSATDEGPCQWN